MQPNFTILLGHIRGAGQQGFGDMYKLHSRRGEAIKNMASKKDVLLQYAIHCRRSREKKHGDFIGQERIVHILSMESHVLPASERTKTMKHDILIYFG